jgi:hypothetical protein
MKQVILSALCLSSLAFAPPALACACLCFDEGNDPASVKQQEQREIERADYFFSGYILKREKPFRLQDLFGANAAEAPVKVTILPVQILKGATAPEITVWENGPISCRAALPVEKGFVKVLAYRAEGRLQLSPCTCARSVFNRLTDAPH